MTSTTFFIIFIPILSLILLAVNLLLAPHNPYQEKDSVFECGFKLKIIFREKRIIILKTGFILFMVCSVTSSFGLNTFSFTCLLVTISLFLVYLPRVVLLSGTNITGFGNRILGILTNILYLFFFYVVFYILVNFTITEEFSSNYKSITPIFIFLGATMLIMVVFSIINSRKTTISELKKKFTLFWNIFIERPGKFLMICGLLFIFLMGFYYFIRANLGIQISTESWVLFYITVVSGLIAFKLLLGITVLYFNKNTEKFYDNISLNPLILLALIPSTGFYYIWVLPHYCVLHNILLGRLGNIIHYFEHALTLITQKSYKGISFRNILSLLFEPVYCDSPIETAKLFEELPFSNVDSQSMVQELRTSTSNKSKLELIAEYEAFRSTIARYTPKKSYEITVLTVETAEEQLGRGKKRALSYSEGELFNLKKTKRFALDNDSDIHETLDNSMEIPSRNPNTIVKQDFMNTEFKFDVVYSKISNFIEQQGINKRDVISKLSFEPKSLKKDFYSKLKDLKLLNNKKMSVTYIGTLLKSLESYIDITPINPNSIIKRDFINTEFKSDVIYRKITNLVEQKAVNKKDFINKLFFEPESLKQAFFHKLGSLELINNKNVRFTQIETLQKALKKEKDLILFRGDFILEDDLKNFNYNSIYTKILNLIESGVVNKKQHIGKLIFGCKELKAEFYDQMATLGLANNKDIHSITIEQLIRNIEKYVDIKCAKSYSINKHDFWEDSLKCKIIYDKIKSYSINKHDFWEDSLKCKIIYDKINILIDSRKDVDKKSPLSKLFFEPENLREVFYTKLRVLHGKGSLPSTLETLQNRLHQEIRDNTNSITKNDLIAPNFNYEVIYSKISNLINLGEVSPEKRISSLKFYPESLKEDFYSSTEILRLVNGRASKTRIKNLMQGLEKYIGITTTNPYSINESDILEDSLNYRSVYTKISNLMKNNQVEGKDTFSKLIFEPENLRKVFYNKVIDLNLSNLKQPSAIKIKPFMDTLENKIMLNYFDGTSTNDHCIKINDIETGLNYKSVYVKISNLIKYNNAGANDNVSKLIFEPKSLRKDFYAIIQDLDLTKNKQVYRTKIGYLKERFKSEIIKEYI